MTTLWIQSLVPFLTFVQLQPFPKLIPNVHYYSVLTFFCYCLFQIALVFSVNTCRDSWVKNLAEEEFSVYSCAKCFVQVFMEKKLLTIKLPPTPPYWLHHTKIGNISFPADPTNDSSPICRIAGLDDDECSKWKQCCFVARECCSAMLKDDTDGKKHSISRKLVRGKWFCCYVRQIVSHILRLTVPKSGLCFEQTLNFVARAYTYN